MYSTYFAWTNLAAVPRALTNELSPFQTLPVLGWFAGRASTVEKLLARMGEKLECERDEDGDMVDATVVALPAPGCSCKNPCLGKPSLLSAEDINVLPECQYYTPIVDLRRIKFPEFLAGERWLEPWAWVGVRSLKLGKCGLTDEHGVQIGKALGSGETALAELRLNGNQLGDKAGLALAQALAGNTTLTMLDLDDNGLGEQAGLAIAQALATNAALTELELDRNQLGEKAGLAIAQALASNATLTSLSLEDNMLGEDKAKEALRKLNSATLVVTV